MKFSYCERCNHRLFSLLYTPRYCRECGSERLATVSFTEWIAAGAIIAAAVYYLSR